MDRVFSLVVEYKAHIIRLWKAGYLLLIAVLFWGSRAIYLQLPNAESFSQLGVKLGQVALVVFILVAIPGICRRFGIRHKLISIVMIFRRYLGITVYLLALMHASFVRFVPLLAGWVSLPRPLFEAFGTLAFVFLLPLFLTSNDWSVARLGIWWQRIHNLFYLILWLIFAHVALQRVSIWSVLIGITGIAEIISFVWVKKRQTV